MHTNLFDHGDQGQVYQILQRDYERDFRQARLMDFALAATIAYLARHLDWSDFAGVLVLGFLVLSRLNTFIDNSNRNFFMHAIDWLRTRDYERAK